MAQRPTRARIARTRYAAILDPKPPSLHVLRDVRGPKAQTWWERQRSRNP